MERWNAKHGCKYRSPIFSRRRANITKRKGDSAIAWIRTYIWKFVQSRWRAVCVCWTQVVLKQVPSANILAAVVQLRPLDTFNEFSVRLLNVHCRHLQNVSFSCLVLTWSGRRDNNFSLSLSQFIFLCVFWSIWLSTYRSYTQNRFVKFAWRHKYFFYFSGVWDKVRLESHICN